jgi:hypothetical protein
MQSINISALAGVDHVKLAQAIEAQRYQSFPERNFLKKSCSSLEFVVRKESGRSKIEARAN